MQKPLALSIALCLSLTGCQVFEKSKTWDTVMSVRPGDVFHEADPSSSYAEKLHRALLDQGVEHYVVTYQYHYYTHHYEEALGTRTAVVYRDDANASYPWWLKDDRTANPVWLPNGELDKQLSFYCRRPAEIIEKKHYPAGGRSGKETSGKEIARPRTAAVVQPRVHVVERSQSVTKIAQVKPAPVPATKPAVTYHPITNVKPATTAPAAVTRIRHTPVASVQHTPVVSTPKQKSAAAEIATGPAMIDPVQQASDPGRHDERLEKLFRLRNGTSYDRTSAVDRRKMEQIKHGLVGQETAGEDAFRRGVDGLSAF